MCSTTCVIVNHSVVLKLQTHRPKRTVTQAKKMCAARPPQIRVQNNHLAALVSLSGIGYTKPGKLFEISQTTITKIRYAPVPTSAMRTWRSAANLFAVESASKFCGSFHLAVFGKETGAPCDTRIVHDVFSRLQRKNSDPKNQLAKWNGQAACVSQAVRFFSATTCTRCVCDLVTNTRRDEKRGGPNGVTRAPTSLPPETCHTRYRSRSQELQQMQRCLPSVPRQVPGSAPETNLEAAPRLPS